MAPSSPSPTVNMPATPPARNAIFSARRSPDSRAAFAVRTFARTASHIPAYPVSALNTAPRMNASERPTLIDNSECVGVLGRRQQEEQHHGEQSPGRCRPSGTDATDRRFAPSWIARAISFIFSVPSEALRTSRTR